MYCIVYVQVNCLFALLGVLSLPLFVSPLYIGLFFSLFLYLLRGIATFGVWFFGFWFCFWFYGSVSVSVSVFSFVKIFNAPLRHLKTRLGYCSLLLNNSHSIFANFAITLSFLVFGFLCVGSSRRFLRSLV